MDISCMYLGGFPPISAVEQPFSVFSLSVCPRGTLTFLPSGRGRSVWRHGLELQLLPLPPAVASPRSVTLALGCSCRSIFSRFLSWRGSCVFSIAGCRTRWAGTSSWQPHPSLQSFKPTSQWKMASFHHCCGIHFWLSLSPHFKTCEIVSLNF